VTLKHEGPSESGFFARMRSRGTTVVPPIDTVPWGIRVASAWSWRLLVIAAALGVVFWLVAELRYLVIPLLIAVLLGALLVPVVDWLGRHRWPRWLAVTVVEIGLIALVGGLVLLVVWQSRVGSGDLVDRSVTAWDQFTAFLAQEPFNISPDELNGWIADLVSSIQSDVLVSGALSLGSSVGHVLAGILLTLFSTIFVLLDGRGIWAWTVRLLPRRARPAVMGASKAGWVTLGNFTRVQILVASIDAVGIGLGVFFLGLPLAFPIAVIVFLGSFIPIVGAIFTGFIAVLVALVYSGPWVAFWMLIIVLGVQQLEGHVLQPAIMGNAVKIHPLAIVLAVTAGGFIAGIAGALFAVPLVAFLNAAILYIAQGRWRTTPNPTVKDILPSD
jgi:predicted PurR-regulated permease PerM